MRVLQLIDSLDAGGAERMAVNYANALSEKIEFSGIVVTRKEGSLCSQIETNVSYFFLDKKNTFDLFSIFRLRKIIIASKITHIHAHSTSFFTAFLVKLTFMKIKLIWHDHYGDSEFLNKRSSAFLRFCMLFFDGIIVVNEKLKVWANQKLKFDNVIYLPNFTLESHVEKSITNLKGIEGKRIVFLANLRAQKDHFFLIEIAKKLKQTNPDWTFHLVGKDFEDDYSSKIKKLITEYQLHNNVYVYGSVSDIEKVLSQSNIGILTSSSEGLPVALLEYGLAKLPVVVTAVGEMPSIIKNLENGFIVQSKDLNLFLKNLNELITNSILRIKLGNQLSILIQDKFSKDSVAVKYIEWLTNQIE